MRVSHAVAKIPVGCFFATNISYGNSSSVCETKEIRKIRWTRFRFKLAHFRFMARSRLTLLSVRGQILAKKDILSTCANYCTQSLSWLKPSEKKDRNQLELRKFMAPFKSGRSSFYLLNSCSMWACHIAMLVYVEQGNFWKKFIKLLRLTQIVLIKNAKIWNTPLIWLSCMLIPKFGRSPKLNEEIM